MAHIGYARVSTIDQDLDTQLARLKAEGFKVIRSEKMSEQATMAAPNWQ
jgi:DNA invertase Pin-like site-specific DNA recombinase